MRGWRCKSGSCTYGTFVLSASEINFPCVAITANESFFAFAALNASIVSSVLPGVRAQNDQAIFKLFFRKRRQAVVGPDDDVDLRMPRLDEIRRQVRSAHPYNHKFAKLLQFGGVLYHWLKIELFTVMLYIVGNHNYYYTLFERFLVLFRIY